MRREKLNALFTEKLQVPRGVYLTDDTRLREDLRIDSVMILQLLVHIEVELGLQVPEDEIDPKAFLTIGSLLDFIGQLSPLASGGTV
ncbi:phosphopantetheine-binding protein [Paenibacillus sp. FJAT-26967]|uniref:phosphopantetheine-binding protein n=1 Tax=Paenibacillus sp. FJAT-26967 TaxID=1729690 RepID=UPI000A050C60|nr:phosphopantetheine-binding protein [Paenibacillus sp. FJAT-26967]